MKQIELRESLFGVISKACLAALLLTSANQTVSAADASPKWEPCGWGGGGFYYATVFHPTQKNVIYMGGDVAGVYKTEDSARTWRLINNGLADYGVFSLAVDQKNPQTVYAATEGGLCKSIDGGEQWQLLPKTGKKELRITGEKGKSIRSIAVSPNDGNIIYAGSPGGKVFKSTDGGQTWAAVYEKKTEQEPPEVLRVQFGKVNANFFGGMWIPFTFPAGVKSEDCVGFGFSFKGDKSQQERAFVTLKTSAGAVYQSKNIAELFKNDQWQDVVLTAKDFSLEPEFAKKNADKITTIPATPDWATVNRMDFSCAGALPTASSIGRFTKLFFAVTRTPDGQTGTAEKPVLLTVKDFVASKSVQFYGNIRIGSPGRGPVYSMSVAAKDPNMVLAATADAGLVLSEDAGQTWTELNAPKKAANATVDPANPNIIYGAFFTDGVWKSTDKGKTWASSSEGLNPKMAVKEVAVSPANSQNVYAIGAIDWGGGFYMSNDGGKTWKNSSSLTVDSASDPTFGGGVDGKTPLSIPTNVAINPSNPKELFISANWRNCLSEDGGLTWTERNRGADITCVTDIRFSNGKAYVSAMDEGTFVTEDGGKKWLQLWPLKYSLDFTGHNWRLAVNNIDGKDHIIGTCSPWVQTYPARVVVSEDSGKSFKVTTAGLPDYTVRANTMWGAGYPRALSVDPKNPKIAYMGIDGDPSDGKMGGGIFKSQDGGMTWAQLPNQPSGRRMFFGLMVDPTDSNRIYWGACGNNGGLHVSEDAGATWKRVFTNELWVFNLLVTNDGTVYCPGQNLWKSTDHGTTWKKLTNFNNGRQIIGLEVDPRDPKTMWISATTWDGSSNGAVYKTIDDGATWTEITGNLQYVKPMVLRFNPKTNELWAGGVTLNKLKQ